MVDLPLRLCEQDERPQVQVVRTMSAVKLPSCPLCGSAIWNRGPLLSTLECQGCKWSASPSQIRDICEAAAKARAFASYRCNPPDPECERCNEMDAKLAEERAKGGLT